MVVGNVDLAESYYYTFSLSQAFSRPEAQRYMEEIEATDEDIAAYLQKHGSFKGLDLPVDRRALGIIKLILTQGADKSQEQVRGTTIASLDRMLEEVLEPGREERIESLYATAA
jgi:hypothetical protein